MFRLPFYNAEIRELYAVKGLLTFHNNSYNRDDSHEMNVQIVADSSHSIMTPKPESKKDKRGRRCCEHTLPTQWRDQAQVEHENKPREKAFIEVVFIGRLTDGFLCNYQHNQWHEDRQEVLIEICHGLIHLFEKVEQYYQEER